MQTGCNRPLLLFLGVSGPILVPYANPNPGPNPNANPILVPYACAHRYSLWRSRVLRTAGAFRRYGLVISGAYQQEHGNRILWFWDSWKHPILMKVVLCNALLALCWWIAGSAWLFSAGSNCRANSPSLYWWSLVAWSALLLLNLPVMTVLLTPCALLCRLPPAFRLVALLSGIQSEDVQQLTREGRAIGVRELGLITD